MNTDRELMQQALEALEWVNTSVWLEDCYHAFDEEVAALRERLAQPNEFHPDGDAMAVMVEEKQSMAKRIAELEAQPEQEPVAWEDVLGAIARGWTHDDNKHKPMDVQLAVAIAKEIQDMVTVPPQRKPLTPREIELLEGMIEVQLHHAAQCDLIANRVMADKQKGWDMERVELLRKLKEKNT